MRPLTDHDIVTVPVVESTEEVVSAGFNKDGFQRFVKPNNSQDNEVEDPVFDSSPSGFDPSAWKTND
jgi:hypothetical protein